MELGAQLLFDNNLLVFCEGKDQFYDQLLTKAEVIQIANELLKLAEGMKDDTN